MKRGMHIGLAYTMFAESSDLKSMITVTLSGHARD
jgi:hypothetical protein